MVYQSKRPKVFVAMSGGVDSSVAAALLKKQGFDVIGIFMKFWKPPTNIFGGKCYATENKCCSDESERTARSVANKLKIPFYVFDFGKEFKKEVVNYFLREYSQGKTPNPCIVCNQKIKFGLLLKKVLSLGADYLATGHYVKKIKNKLFVAKDKKKDQSYFLWTLTQKQLRYLLFPIGDYTKDEVRKIAADLKLLRHLADQKESYDVCFIPRLRPALQGFGGQAANSHNKFLKKYLKLKSGSIVTTDGQKIGEHQGLPLYTIGQRREIGIGGIGPFYVVECDYKKNRLVVTSNLNDPSLFKKTLIAEKVNWVSGQAPRLPACPAGGHSGQAKIRYGHKAESATIQKFNNAKYKVFFKESQRAVTPGQSVVFYKNKKLLGGGIIIRPAKM